MLIEDAAMVLQNTRSGDICPRAGSFIRSRVQTRHSSPWPGTVLKSPQSKDGYPPYAIVVIEGRDDDTYSVRLARNDVKTEIGESENYPVRRTFNLRRTSGAPTAYAG